MGSPSTGRNSTSVLQGSTRRLNGLGGDITEREKDFKPSFGAGERSMDHGPRKDAEKSDMKRK